MVCAAEFVNCILKKNNIYKNIFMDIHMIIKIYTHLYLLSRDPGAFASTTKSSSSWFSGLSKSKSSSRAATMSGSQSGCGPVTEKRKS